jgi:hypothetical protein
MKEIGEKIKKNIISPEKIDETGNKSASLQPKFARR